MRNYFGGWYFKTQNAKQTLAVISAYHITGGDPSSSVQIINDEGAWNVPYAALDCIRANDGFSMRIGENRFEKNGLYLSIQTPDCTAEGSLKFDPFTPVRSHIMGPFRFVPFLECRHDVRSLYHTVTGAITVNGVRYDFDRADGYIEGDRGRSFPRHYLWTHCFFEKNSLMLSVADIPFGMLRFTGVLCSVWWEGKEYRLATYRGARVKEIGQGKAVICQGDMELTVQLLEKHAHPLYAPAHGAMTRTIRESASCVASYTFRRGGETLFSFTSDRASFEYEYPQQEKAK